MDSNFDDDTKIATIVFQKKNNLHPDGIVGNKTFGLAMQLGFSGIIDDRIDKSGASFPPKPSFSPLTGNAERQAIFGTFTFVPKPVPGNPENIRITNTWVKDNIITVSIPQLTNIKSSSKVESHKLAANQLKKLWSDWEAAGLLHLVLTWVGSYVARFVRGKAKQQILSNHSFGSAFDINFEWNKLGVIPALVGQKGSVRELVEIANQNGFYWAVILPGLMECTLRLQN